jgi:arsenate reductase (thioredoxin)
MRNCPKRGRIYLPTLFLSPTWRLAELLPHLLQCLPSRSLQVFRRVVIYLTHQNIFWQKVFAMSKAKHRVLFLCTHNSARSQMAEGLLRHLHGDGFEVHSAGTEATSGRPGAVRAMAELGIDISRQQRKTLEGYLGQPFDYVITVCDDANEACPVFPGAKQRLHWSFEDPSQATGTEEERLQAFRRVRDGLKERIEDELLL